MALHCFRARALSLILRSRTILSAPDAPPVVSLHRLLCSAATTASYSTSSPPSFAVEDYLVSRCGLTRAQALKAAKKISSLRSRSSSKPDAVLAFLGGTLGVPPANIAAAVVRDPRILYGNVERVMKPRIAELSNLGLSRDEIARLIPLFPCFFYGRFLSRNLEFWLKELGSFDKVLQALRMSTGMLAADMDRVLKPNMAFLRQCGLNASELLTSNIYAPRLFTVNPKCLQEAAKQVEELGVRRGTGMFPRVLLMVCLTSKEIYAKRVQLLLRSGFSQDDVREIVRKAPVILGLSDQKVQGNIDFLMKDVRLDVPYIARRPVLLLYSVEGRLVPRRWLLKVLREKGLLTVDLDYYATASLSEKLFVEKFVFPYKDLVPGLADGYASKCSRKAANRVALKED